MRYGNRFSVGLRITFAFENGRRRRSSDPHLAAHGWWLLTIQLAVWFSHGQSVEVRKPLCDSFLFAEPLAERKRHTLEFSVGLAKRVTVFKPIDDAGTG